MSLPNKLRAEKSLALYEQFWGEGQDIISEETILTQLGQEALDYSKSEAAKAALMENTQRAADKGAFGAPTLFVDDEIFFGCDRMAQLKYHLQLA